MTDQMPTVLNCLPRKMVDMMKPEVSTKCLLSGTKTTCEAEDLCFWVNRNQSATELFNKEWCHPIAAKAKDGQVAMTCSNNTETSCALDTNCLYGSLKDVIPSGAFCGVDPSMPYPIMIMNCLDKSENDCGDK